MNSLSGLSRLGTPASAFPPPTQNAGKNIANPSLNHPTGTHPNQFKIEGHIFYFPVNRIECFRSIREQTTISYRAIAGGAPSARDFAFIFGPPAIVSGGNGQPQPSPATTTSSAANGEHHMPITNARQTTDSDTSCLKIDGYSFEITADPVGFLRCVREQTTICYRAIASGASSPMDFAFIFGVPTMEVPSMPSVGDGEAGGGMVAGSGCLSSCESSLSSCEDEDESEGDEADEVDPDEGDEGDEFDEMGRSGQGEKCQEGGEIEQVRQGEEYEEHEEEEGEEEYEEVYKDDADDEDYKDEELDPFPHTKRTRSQYYTASMSPPADTPNRPKPEKTTANAANAVNESKTTNAANTPATQHSTQSRVFAGVNYVFVGDFLDLDDAKNQTGMSTLWCRGKYVQGLITLKGRAAKTIRMRWPCQYCRMYKRKTACRVLVDTAHHPFWSQSCGHCLQGGFSCGLRERGR